MNSEIFYLWINAVIVQLISYFERHMQVEMRANHRYRKIHEELKHHTNGETGGRSRRRNRHESNGIIRGDVSSSAPRGGSITHVHSSYRPSIFSSKR